MSRDYWSSFSLSSSCFLVLSTSLLFQIPKPVFRHYIPLLYLQPFLSYLLIFLLVFSNSGLIFKFLWVPSHIGVVRNETADFLATTTRHYKRHIKRSLLQFKFRFPIFIFFIPFFFLFYLFNSPQPWLLLLDYLLSRYLISSYFPIWPDNNRAPAHSFHLSLNNSRDCTPHVVLVKCDSQHLLFKCSSLSAKRLSLSQLFLCSHIPLSYS